jgi:hypothetical protein
MHAGVGLEEDEGEGWGLASGFLDYGRYYWLKN